ncbi:protein AATF-like [Ostrinia nubilalis]|uniref:protein AATF-like n=1 Tax=Ostrinia nubilalis TaxID=29057 RepID=UPI0030825856
MKFKQKKTSKTTLSEKIANALTLKPRADIEDDQVFGTKPHTVSRADFSSSDSKDETAISDFRKRNVNLLSDISKKYEGQVISRKELENSDESSDDSESEGKQNNNFHDNSDESEEESELEDTKDSNLIKKFIQLTKADDSDDSDEKHTKSTTQKKSKKPTSKQELESDSGDNSESDEESDDYGITQFKKQLENDDSDEQSEDDDEGDEDDDDEEGYDISQMDEPPKEEFEHVKKQNVSEEAKKGACVRNQLLVWEGLLEMRIHLQRCMTTANQMPMPDTYDSLKGNNEFIEECNATKSNITSVLDKFLTLQNLLFKNFPETKNLSSKQKSTEVKEQSKEESDEEIPSDTDNEEIPSDTEPEDNGEQEEKSPKKNNKQLNQAAAKKRKLEDYEKEIATSHKAFKSFRDSTIQKWNDKTRLATASNVKNTPTNTVLQQISYILSDRDKLIKRTQLKRSEYDIVGYEKPSIEENGEKNGTDVNTGMRDRKDNDEYIPEIFDDSDFYHQLLRELIECKSADISDPVQLSRQWIALQQMRSKMKRKVDTKATKGRKIKYVVHNQLVNYMAPEKCTTWTDESTNELYSSLFGKMFEQNNVGLNDNLSNVFKIK